LHRLMILGHTPLFFFFKKKKEKKRWSIVILFSFAKWEYKRNA